jgi:hypothetical protein
MSTPEGAVLKAILQYLAARHVLAFRMNTLAMPTADGRRFIKAGVPGMADVLAFPTPEKCPTCHDNLGCYDDFGEAVSCGQLLTIPLWIEAKAVKGKQSELQKSFQAQVEAEGHRYIIARSIEDVEAVL